MHACQRTLRKRQRPLQPGHGQAVGNVLARLLRAQCVEVVARDDALRQLFQLRRGHHGAQLGLADQDDLQQLALAGLQVGQQAQLLQHVRRQVLRLVDDEHVVAPGRVLAQQEVVERVQTVLDGLGAGHRGPVGDAELVANGTQQLGHRELGIEDVGHVAVRGHLLQEAAAHGGLAGAYLAREQHEAAARIQPVEQMRQGLAVPFAHEQVARVGGDGKRRLCKAEEGCVHGAEDTTPRRSAWRRSRRAANRHAQRDSGFHPWGLTL